MKTLSALALTFALTAYAAASPLHDAAVHGDTKTVGALIDAGADLNATNAFGATALDWAANQGRTETAAALRAAGAR